MGRLVIKGQGIDIVEMARIESVYENHSERFLTRVLTPAEREQCNDARYLAKRWAAKEAIAKALGTGIGAKVSFQDIEVLRQHNAPPKVQLTGGAAQCLTQKGAQNVWLSLSDERAYTVAVATIE